MDVEPGDGVCIGGMISTTPSSNSTMSTSFMSETTDQELSIQDLQSANGGILMLLAALLLGVANAPAKGDHIYTKPSLWEVVTTMSTLGEPDGTEGNSTNVAPGPDGKGCTDRNLPF